MRNLPGNHGRSAIVSYLQKRRFIAYCTLGSPIVGTVIAAPVSKNGSIPAEDNKPPASRLACAIVVS